MNRAVGSSSSAGTDTSQVGSGDSTGSDAGEGDAQTEAREPRSRGAGLEGVDPASAAPPTLPQLLDAARVHAIAAIDRVVVDIQGRELPARVLAFGDDQSTSVCVAPTARPLCWSAPIPPRYVGEISVWESAGRLRTQLSFGHPDGGYVSVVVHGEDLQATRSREGSATQAFDELRPREVPALFDQLAGLDLVMARSTLVARREGEVRVCRRRDARFACTAPALLPALEGEQSWLRSVDEDFPGLVSLEYSWQEQVGDVYTSGQAILYVRASASEVRQLAHVVVAYGRRSRVSLERDDLEELEFGMFDVEARQSRCIAIGPATLRRTVERANGTTRTLPAPRLRRAPDVLPAQGVEPLDYDLRGAWAFEPAGGLRRIARCAYEDE